MIQRMDNVLVVVEDLEAAKAFFAELGMELEGETTVEGPWVDQTVGLNDVRADITMMRTPDGHGRVELSKFHRPPAVRAEPESAPANALGMRRIMFMVDDVDDVVSRLRSHCAELVGEIAQYEDVYRALLRAWPRGHHHRAVRAAQLKLHGSDRGSPGPTCMPPGEAPVGHSSLARPMKVKRRV